MSEAKEYLLAGGAAELERLRLQARVWEPEVEVMLEMIGVAPGWRCIDLGCGAMGILGPLSRRAGPKGEVVGVDTDAKQLDAARAYVTGENLKNVKVLEQDAYNHKASSRIFRPHPRPVRLCSCGPRRGPAARDDCADPPRRNHRDPRARRRILEFVPSKLFVDEAQRDHPCDVLGGRRRFQRRYTDIQHAATGRPS